MNPFWEVADFVRGLRREMRFGELSRASLRLLRLELNGSAVACDWMARPPDIWDASLRRRERERSESEQALRDAIRVRDLTFAALPDVESAALRAFRPSAAREPPDLIITGKVGREPPPILRVSSLAMRAKLYGFQFETEDGILRALDNEEKGICEIEKRNSFSGSDPLGGKEIFIYGCK